MLVGLEQPTGGRMVLEEEELSARPGRAERLKRARRLQIVFQDPYTSLDPHQSAPRMRDAVQRVHFSRSRGARAGRTDQLLEAVGPGRPEGGAPSPGVRPRSRQRTRGASSGSGAHTRSTAASSSRTSSMSRGCMPPAAGSSTAAPVRPCPCRRSRRTSEEVRMADVKEGRLVIDDAGHEIYYRLFGSGAETLVGLHGGPGADHRYLARLGELADDGLQVLLYDQLGSGQ